jgi:hypothetical protein
MCESKRKRARVRPRLLIPFSRIVVQCESGENPTSWDELQLKRDGAGRFYEKNKNLYIEETKSKSKHVEAGWDIYVIYKYSITSAA